MRLPRLPASFALKQPTTQRARAVLDLGIAGTGMQAMAQNMSAEQQDAVIAHLQSLFSEGETKGASK